MEHPSRRTGHPAARPPAAAHVSSLIDAALAVH